METDDYWTYKSISCRTRTPKVVMRQIALVFKIPEDVVFEMIGEVFDGSATAIEDATVDFVKQVGIRLSAVRVDALVVLHVIAPVDGAH